MCVGWGWGPHPIPASHSTNVCWARAHTRTLENAVILAKSAFWRVTRGSHACDARFVLANSAHFAQNHILGRAKNGRENSILEDSWVFGPPFWPPFSLFSRTAGVFWRPLVEDFSGFWRVNVIENTKWSSRFRYSRIGNGPQKSQNLGKSRRPNILPRFRGPVVAIPEYILRGFGFGQNGRFENM